MYIPSFSFFFRNSSGSTCFSGSLASGVESSSTAALLFLVLAFLALLAGAFFSSAGALGVVNLSLVLVLGVFAGCASDQWPGFPLVVVTVVFPKGETHLFSLGIGLVLALLGRSL